MRDLNDILKGIFEDAMKTPEERFEIGIEKTNKVISLLRTELYETEQLMNKLHKSNSCDDMLEIVEKIEGIDAGINVLKLNTISIHSMHIELAPQHEHHRNMRDNGGLRDFDGKFH